MSDTPRVLYLAHSVAADGGGMERQGRALIDALCDQVQFIVVASEGLEELPAHVDVAPLRLPRRPAFLRIALFYLRSGALVRQLRPLVDEVHSCGAITPEVVDVATVHLCQAAVPAAADGDRRGWRRLNSALARGLARWIERRQYRPDRTRQLVAVSDVVAAQLATHYPATPRTVIANGVDDALFHPAPRDDDQSLRVVVVAGDFALKGVDLALAALALAPHVALTVVGRGPIEQYHALASELGVRDRVRFTGARDDVAALLQQSDVLLCASHYEAFGLTMVEGALSGCAVVATDVGVARAIVGDAQGGRIVSREPQDVADALELLHADRDRLHACQRVAAERAALFTVGAMAARYAALYRGVGSLPSLNGGVPSAPTSVLHVGLESPAVRMGGLNRYLDELARAQRQRGSGVEVTQLGLAAQDVRPGTSWPVREWRFARRMWRSRAEIIDVHFAAHAYLAVRFGALRGRPLVVHFQGPWADESRTQGQRGIGPRLKAHLEGYVLRRADVVVTLSTAFRDLAIQNYRVAPHRIDVLSPGVNHPDVSDRAEVRRRLSLDTHDEVVLAVRRLVPRMGLDGLLRALATHPNPNELLVIVGEGQERHSLEALATSLGVRARFCGFVDDATLSDWYDAADVVVVPSVAHEGFGLVVLEALSHGTPVVASDLEGLRDAARGRPAVQLVAVDDAVGWRAALDGVRAHPEWRDAARASVADDGWAHVAARHDAIYRELCDGPSRKGVVYLDHTAVLSGGELALVRLVDGLDQRWRPHIVLAAHGPLEEELAQRSLSFEVLEFDEHTLAMSRDQVSQHIPLRAIAHSLHYAVRLRRLLARRQPTVVHTNSMKAHLYGAVASVFAPWHVVFHVRDHWAPPYLPHSLLRPLRWLAKVVPDRVLANSTTTALSVGRGAVVLPSPVEDRFFAVPDPHETATVRVAVIGRLAPWKGQDLAIRAFAARRSTTPATLTIVGGALFGEDDYAASLVELAQQLGVDDVVRFEGPVADVAAALASIDVVVLSSLSPEPFGNVVVEAMAAGRCVVVPDRGGVTEFVIESVSGVFYPMGDEGALTAVLDRVLDDAPLRRRLGVQAREAVVPFAVPGVARDLEAIYDGLG